AHPDPFCCRAEWQIAFHEAFAPRRPLHLRRADDNLLAFAELRDGIGDHVLEPLESHWQFGCPVVGDDPVPLLGAFVSELATNPNAQALEVSGLAPDGELARRIVGALRDRCEIYALASTPLRSASLAGGLDGFLGRRSANLRRNLRQASRRAGARGVTFTRHVPRTGAAARELHERMLAVERTSWKGLEHCGMAEPPISEFYGRLLERLAGGGNGRVVLAHDGDGADIGFAFGGLAGPVFRGQQFSFTDSWRHASIGNLLQLELLGWLCDECVERYDMGPVMDYKLHWTELETPIATLLICLR
ncbi:MAG: GNAT family N-acetyltransferase, partial [Planctomycetes bacterium]|nr:GNAT family N-acetyltransferase [Planctomycetota bacterium]